MNTKEKCLKPVKPKTTYGDTLRFTPYAYAKLIWMRDRGPTEVAGYCVTGTEDPLLVTDFILIKQECTSVTFDLDPEDGVTYIERMMDTGLPPWTFSNILAHTHPPGCSPNPSDIDEINFKKAFSHPNWAIMLIVATNGDSYCRLKINVGPGIEKQLKVQVDFNQTFNASNHPEWETEYKEKVTKKQFLITGKEKDIIWPYFEPIKPHEDMTLYKYENEDDEICCYWDKDGNVVYYDGDDDTCYSYDPTLKKWYTEDMFDSEGNMQEMEIPQKPWVSQVIAWSEEHFDESNVLTER